MKLRFLFFLLLTSAAVVATAADNSPFTGEWQIHRVIAGNEGDQTCTLTQKDSELTGTCSSEGAPLKITGKAEGKTATWTYKTEHDGSPVTVIHKGTLAAANKITGTITAVEYGVEGEFTAVRAK